MLAKLIAYGENREESIVRMKRALSEFGIGGVKTNIEFQYSIYATIRKINIDSHVKPNIPSGMWTKCDKCHLKNLIKT